MRDSIRGVRNGVRNRAKQKAAKLGVIDAALKGFTLKVSRKFVDGKGYYIISEHGEAGKAGKFPVWVWNELCRWRDDHVSKVRISTDPISFEEAMRLIDRYM